MFNSNFNNNFQNPYPDQTNNMNNNQDMNMLPPEFIPNNLTYPSALPAVSMPNTQNPQQNYAEGGEVRKSRKKQSKFPNLYPSLAEMIRGQGEGEDTILAHINPLEAMMLQQMGGSGTINPVTGLPQYGFFNKPWKALKSVLGGAGGAILGNMILPGVGGVIGGALGQGTQHAIRGKNAFHGALKGGAMGAVLPTAASLLGSGASKLGMNSAGNFLSNYGAENSVLSSLGLGRGGVPAGDVGGATSGRSSLNNMITGNSGATGMGSMGEAAKEAAKGSWYDKWLEPQNLLTAATVAGSFMNRPKERKEKSPEQIAAEEKRYRNASRLNRAEIEADEAAEFLKQQANYRLRHNLAGGESLAASPMYRKVNTPDEYRKHGRWLGYYPNSDFSGNPLPFKIGGKVPEMRFEEEEMEYPSGMGFYLKGHTGGQDDKIPAKLSDGEYVIPADVVSHAGDGNNDAGAKKFDALLKNIRKAKGGTIHLPPKAKSLASYMIR